MIISTSLQKLLDRATSVLPHDPTTGSYSYAFIDLDLPYSGDKRLFGWDDYPHEGVIQIERLDSYPHHYHRRDENGCWIFEASSMRGDLTSDINTGVEVLKAYLEADHSQEH
jgi:hypothetical protein